MQSLSDFLTPHFRWQEFFSTPEDWAYFTATAQKTQRVVWLNQLTKLAQQLEWIRAHCLDNRAIHITSGFRCPEHNKAAGGHVNSFHLKGMAADIVVKGLSPAQVQALLVKWPGGMGYAQSFTHVDIRPYKARWRYAV